MIPSNSGEMTNGIARVVNAYHRYTRQYGVEYVEKGSYDLLATHAGAGDEKCDVAHCHGLYWTADYDAPDWEYKTNARVIAALRNAKVITVPSQWVAQSIRRDMRIDPAVVPHGIEWDEWQEPVERLDYVLYNKNRQGDVCDATPVSWLAQARPDIQFISTFGVKAPSNVKITGVLPHNKMKEVVRRAGVYLAPTKETFGIGILEAMASGVPVLGYAHGGILDLVQHGVNGYLAAPGDGDDLLRGLEYCLRYNRMLGENGRELAKRFTWDIVARQIAAVYEAALKPDPPTAAIIIPTYNYGGLVGRAIESAIAQTYKNLTDIIVVDDGSTDGTDITSYLEKDKRVKFIKQKNQGVAHARNAGIAATNAKYICCLDADDKIKPTFLQATIPALEADRTLGIAYTGLSLVGPRGEHTGSWPGQFNYDEQVKGQNQVPTCCVFRRSVWERLGGYRQRYAPGGCGTEDAEFWLRFGSVGFGAKKVTDAPLFEYTIGGRTTGDSSYKETDWLGWHPWTRDKQHPFASIATPGNHSHPVRQYDTPIVSVIIPVGPGHERHVWDALDSLESQTMRQWEGIVVWDTGNDIPVSLQNAYPHIQFIQTEGKLGAGAARNIGAKNANSGLFLFLDADDLLLPNALQVMVDAYVQADGAVIYSSSFGVRAVDETTAKEYSRHGELVKYERGIATFLQPIADYNYDLAVKQPYLDPPYFWCYVGSLVPREWHDEIGGFDEELAAWEDWDYWIKIAKRGHPFLAVSEPLITYYYDIGKRREQGKTIKSELRKKMQENHKGLEIMGCKKCGSRYVRNEALPVPQQKSEVDMADNDFVLVEYNPGRGGSHGVVGLTVFPNKIAPNMKQEKGGWRFSYGYRTHGDRFLVHRLDQQAMPTWFRVIQAPAAQRVSAPVHTPPPPTSPTMRVPAPTPTQQPATEETFDPQTLPGVSQKMAQAMIAAGFNTREKILAGDLSTVKGISEARAAAIKAALTVTPDVKNTLDELKKLLEK